MIRRQEVSLDVETLEDLHAAWVRVQLAERLAPEYSKFCEAAHERYVKARLPYLAMVEDEAIGAFEATSDACVRAEICEEISPCKATEAMAQKLYQKHLIRRSALVTAVLKAKRGETT